MRFLLGLIACYIISVQAFKDTSPFILFSNSPSFESIRQFSQEQLKSRNHVVEITESFLSACPSETYFILTLPSLSAQELSNDAHHLKQMLKSSGVRTEISIRETTGLNTEVGERLSRYLEETCGCKKVVGWTISDVKEQKESGGNSVVLKNLEGNIEQIDKLIHTNILADITEEFRYTVILVIPKPKAFDEQNYSAQISSNQSQKLELRRRLVARAHNISTSADLRPLFEKYQFLSPGLFSGLLVTAILLAILSVGVSALSSLEVSYGAFDKDLGPVIQKKLS